MGSADLQQSPFFLSTNFSSSCLCQREKNIEKRGWRIFLEVIKWKNGASHPATKASLSLALEVEEDTLWKRFGHSRFVSKAFFHFPVREEKSLLFLGGIFAIDSEDLSSHYFLHRKGKGRKKDHKILLSSLSLHGNLPVTWDGKGEKGAIVASEFV